MASVPIRVLIINRQLNPSIKLKQALEQTGKFVVTTFTSPDAAFDFLRGRPQDIALLDFSMAGMSGIDLILRTRAVQPDIALIASPAQPDVQVVVRDLQLNGIVDMPISARRLIPILEQVFRQSRDALPDTSEAPAYDHDSDTLTIDSPEIAPPLDATPPDFSSLDSVLVHVGGLDEGGGGETLDVDMSDMDKNASARAQSIEFVLKGDFEDLKREVNGPQKGRPLDASAEKAIDIFQKIAAEEPPMPTLEDSGTVGDLRIGVGDANLQEVVRILQERQIKPRPPQEDIEQEAPPQMDFEESGEEMGENTARMILQTALEESAGKDFSIDKIVNNIERQLPEDQRASSGLSSWIENVDRSGSTDRYIREPDFLGNDLSDSGAIAPPPKNLPQEQLFDEDSDELIFDEAPPIEDQESIFDEESSEQLAIREEAVIDAPPPAGLPGMDYPVLEDSDRPDTGMIPVEDKEEYETGFGSAQVEADDLPVSEEPQHDTKPHAVQAPQVSENDVYDTDRRGQSPEIAALALALTQASLELSAEATLLARDGQVEAVAGDLPQEDLQDIGAALQHDWEVQSDQARIRFVTLSTTGRDYMIYSRRTADNFSLSMVFAGNMKLSNIRRQSDQLVQALHSVPDVEEAPPEMVIDEPDVAELTEELHAIEEEIKAEKAITPTDLVPPIDAGPLTMYTFVWLVSDPDFAINNETAQAIVTGLDLQLAREGWRVDQLDVHEDYLYMIAGIPGEVPAHELIANLKRRTAEMAHGSDSRIDPEHFWSDSYLAFVPGRALDVEEIQRYINFARAR